MDSRIDRIERDSDGVWIYLRPGFSRRGEHVIVEDARRAALSHMVDVAPCRCDDCMHEMLTAEFARGVWNAGKPRKR